jgi:hypothetical protein
MYLLGGCGKILFEANEGVADTLDRGWQKQAKLQRREELDCELVAREGTICLLLSGDANDAESWPVLY